MAADYDSRCMTTSSGCRLNLSERITLADAYETVLGGLIHPRWLLASAGSVVIIMRWVQAGLFQRTDALIDCLG